MWSPVLGLEPSCVGCMGLGACWGSMVQAQAGKARLPCWAAADLLWVQQQVAAAWGLSQLNLARCMSSTTLQVMYAA